jgi:hypothetical protein
MTIGFLGSGSCPDRLAHTSQRPDRLRHRGCRPVPAPRAGRSRSSAPPRPRLLRGGRRPWHGAAPNRFMTHLAMLEVDHDGNPATWGDHVTDEEDNAARQELANGSACRRARHRPETLAIVAEREPAGTATTCLPWKTSSRLLLLTTKGGTSRVGSPGRHTIPPAWRSAQPRMRLYSAENK